MNQNVTYWIDMAEYDLETARAMLLTKRYLYVAFMCHQTIEKSLKAIIAGTDDNNEPPKIHNLVRLTERSALSEELSPQQKKFISMLAPMNVEARYTAYKEEIASGLSEKKCAELIKETEDLYSWIKQRLSVT
ncbi:MAG: HEPN domain-containing protein [Oscillospiraceae bacterium]|nr:HEPN domain-containing protein [Oscillospiraceae bacterium]